MDWIPTQTDREGPIYLRIVAALAADIENGRLLPRTAAPDASGAGEGAPHRSHHDHAGVHRRQ